MGSLGVAPLTGQPGPPTDPAADGPNWGAMEGTWLLESAVRDGENIAGMQGMRYYFEPGLMRWASPNIKSDVTKMSIMMARYLKHVEGTRFRTEAIYPPAEDAEVEITVDGDAMVLITQAGVGKPILTITLRRLNKRAPKPPTDKMIGLAQRALAVGELDAAYQFAQLQLMNFPDDKDAALLMAKARLDSALQLESGFHAAELRRVQAQAYWALDKYPDEHALRHKLGAFLSRFMLFPEASQQYEILEQAGQFENDSMLRHVTAEKRLGRQENVKKLLQEMVGYDLQAGAFTGRERIGEANSGYLILADLLAKEGKQDEATKVIDKLVERFPDLPKSQLDRGRFYLAQQDLEKAVENFSKAMKVDPLDREAMLVNIEIHMRDPGEEVEDLIDKAFATHGRQPLLLYLAATRAGLKRDFTKSLTLVDEGLASIPQDQSLLALKVQLFIQKGDFASAESLIQELPSLGTPPLHAKLMHARLLIATKKFSAATRVLAEIDVSKTSPTFAAQVEVVQKELAAAMSAASERAAGGSNTTRDLNFDPGSP
jgi:tetratricopeptide (TPR) repeat protein